MLKNYFLFNFYSVPESDSKPRFECLDGVCYDLISLFIGEKLPSFIFVNKQVWRTFLEFQLEINDEVLNAFYERLNQSNLYSLSSLSHAESGSAKDTMK